MKKSPFQFLLAAALFLSLCPPGAVAPIPPCSPLAFINKVVESEDAAWLFE